MGEFRTYLEMGHILKMQRPIFIDGKKVLSIDLRLEHYPKKYWPMMEYWLRRAVVKLPGEKKYTILYSMEAGLEDQAEAPIRDHILPDFWYDYAEVFFDDGTVKWPTKP